MSALYYKDESICEAIKEAIVSFGKKNSINGMEYFASELGYNGQNKSIQLHNRLHLGNTEKFLKKAELEAILKQMEKPEQKIILSAMCEKFGFNVCESAKADTFISTSVELSVQMGALEVQGLLGLFADEILSDLKDGKINYDEAKRLKRICINLREKTRGIEDALKAVLD